ncbi:MAG: hypothetical protein AB7F35_26620 [Acetobacteraceae bacterium]
MVVAPTFARRGLAGLLLAAITAAQGSADPLPSWRDGARKRAILDSRAATTNEGSTDFVGPAERLAVFDNDGTLWVEQPMYTQLAFALDRGLNDAAAHGWHLISMQHNWTAVFPA